MAPIPKKKPELTSTINRKKLEATVADILKDGTPKWVSHPLDYRNWFEEQEQADKARSDESAKQYRMEDQTELTDEDASLVNFRNVNSFIAVLRNNGLRCKISQTEPQTCELYAIQQGYEHVGFQFITS